MSKSSSPADLSHMIVPHDRCELRCLSSQRTRFVAAYRCFILHIVCVFVVSLGMPRHVSLSSLSDSVGHHVCVLCVPPQLQDTPESRWPVRFRSSRGGLREAYRVECLRRKFTSSSVHRWPTGLLPVPVALVRATVNVAESVAPRPMGPWLSYCPFPFPSV